ncbi:hypothetical protein DPMN_092592 [Dreissena polymorpha]|uniref:Uncharacterized protein n=1 Tax=Dreissena polymorpha TaxID=45954 RepID=A0A9D4R068_DREPO|nr:hypothetical protein DPMN_092592 [Dreissena polymorpha]
MSEFNLDRKVNSCVHDNSRNIECAASMCEDWVDMGLFHNTLQLSLLIQDVPAQLNSIYLMMAHLVEQQHVLTDIMLDTKFTKKQDATLNRRESD